MSFLSLRQISKTNQAQLHLQRCREVPRRLQTFQLGHHFHLAKTRIPFSSRSFIISDPSSANFLCFSSNSFKFSKHSAFSRLCCWCAGTGTPTHRQNLGSFRKHHRKPRVVAPLRRPRCLHWGNTRSNPPPAPEKSRGSNPGRNPSFRPSSTPGNSKIFVVCVL